MRKASHDGGDSTSITSGVESETKKPGAGILKSTRNSIKRKVQHFSDDTANEPLLHKTKEISEIEKQSAKLLLSKTKTDYGCQKGDDKDKLLADEIAQPSISDVTGITNNGVLIDISNGLKEHKYSNSQSISTTSIHNHMNTNVFGNMDGLKNSVAAKTQILVELDASKPTGYSPSPLIFTTAKIHTDGKMQQMEPVQVTPVPILCTIEGGVVKTETKTTESSEKPKNGEFIEITNKNVTDQQSKEKKTVTVTQLTTKIASLSKLPEKHEFNTTSTQNIIGSASSKPAQSVSNFIRDYKDKDASTPKHTRSEVGNIIQVNHAQLPHINKKPKDEIFITKIPQLSQGSNDSTGSKLSSSTIKQIELAKTSKNNPILNKTDLAHKISSTSSTIDKNDVDINKNMQVSSQSDPEERKTGNNQVNVKAVPSKPKSDINKIKELVVGPGIKEESNKMHPCSSSTNKTSKEDQKTTDIKPVSKEEAQYNVSLSSEKSASIIITTTSHNASKTMESNLSKATLPSTLNSSTNKFSAIDKTPLTLSSKTISTDTSKLMKPSSKKSAISENSNVTKTVPSTLSTLTDTTSKIQQTVSSRSSMQSKIKTPISNVTNTSTSEGKIVSTEITGSNFGSANSRSPIAITASTSKKNGNSIITASTTSNNAATVVSSISKPTKTASGIKLASSSTPLTDAVKSEPKPSGIPTISSSVKSSNAVTSDKITATSSPVNKSISNNTKPARTTAKVSATDSSSITSPALSSTAKLPSTSSTKTATENVTHSQDKPM